VAQKTAFVVQSAPQGGYLRRKPVLPRCIIENVPPALGFGACFCSKHLCVHRMVSSMLALTAPIWA
jgi:hypothetical protein